MGLQVQSSASRHVDVLRKKVFEDEPVFAYLAVAFAVAAFAFIITSFFDERIVLDVNVWVKPAKFAIALSLYVGTLAFYARWLPAELCSNKFYRFYTLVVSAAVVAELVWIAGASAAGTTSHFNGETHFMAFIYPVMGALAVVLTSATLFYGVQIVLNRKTGLSDAVMLGLSGGLVLTFFSTVLVAGYLSSHGGHYVGAPGGDAATILFLGWSREVGDLRVAHFFATHAMHAGPLLGLAFCTILPARGAVAATCFALGLYASLIAFTFIQARAGLPFM